MKRRSTKQITSDPPKTTPASTGTGRVDSIQKPFTDDEVRRRIAALKARKPVVEPEPNGFQFDPTEPLRLINRAKPMPDK
jgi:DNA-binding response OmpR family regulator